MRLLKTGPYVPGHERLELIQIWGDSVPPYAILSHTWSNNPEDEVLFADVQHGTCFSKPAYAKLDKAMERARLDGHGWLWIDTCCIDKSSSVELTEAINSMYKYYQRSEICYAYLSDVQGNDFKDSRWWERGWTLQELLAPEKVQFFNNEWESIGWKHSLHASVTEIARIERDYLTGNFPVEHASIAKRMSWAAYRKTTREEDMAYCLIGIFNVNMPMLYGEGATRAFVRLQEEIMKSSEDQSIFAWIKPADGDEKVDGHDEPNGSIEHKRYHGLLADSPKDFERTGNTLPYTDPGDYSPSMMTARGLNMTLPLTARRDGTMVAALNCPVPWRRNSDYVAIYLKPLPIGQGQYARVECSKLASVSELGVPQLVYIRQHFPNFTVQTVYPYHFFQLRSMVCHGDSEELEGYKVIASRTSTTLGTKRAPNPNPEPWSSVPLVYRIDKTAGSLTAALLVKRPADQEAFVLMLGASSEFAIGVDVDVSLDADALEPHASIRKSFSPKAPPADVTLEYHRVQVRVEEFFRADQKIYFVDLEIWAIPKPPTATELIQSAVDMIAFGNRGAAKRDFRDKLKRIF